MMALKMENHHSHVIDSSGEGENVASLVMKSEIAFNTQIFMK